MEAVISAVTMTIFLAAGRPAPDDGHTALKAHATTAQLMPRRIGERKRSKSFTGYIDDSTVTSQVRVRFDAGFGVNAPDRAEFFYAKCGCYIFDPLPNFDPDAAGPGPGVPKELNFQQLYIQADYAMRERFSLFAELPVRAIQPQGFEEFGDPWVPFADQSGLADIRVGAKVALVADESKALTFQVRASIPTGNASRGLSTNNWSIEPALLYNQALTDRLRLEGQIGDLHPFEGSAGLPTAGSKKFAGDVLFYGIGPSYDLVSTERIRFTPVAELVGWRILGGFQTTCPATVCSYDIDKNVVNLKVGARVTVADRSSVYAGYGWGLTSAVWYERVFRLEYRYNF